jgi:hypothetical protein
VTPRKNESESKKCRSAEGKNALTIRKRESEQKKNGLYQDENEVVHKGVKALYRALGPVETGRFLEIAHPKREDSVSAHRKWQKTLNKDDFFKEIFGEKTTGPLSSR